MAETKKKNTKKVSKETNSKTNKEVKKSHNEPIQYDIEVEHLTKTFSRCRNDWERLKVIALPWMKQHRLKVLDDVSFKIARGERVAFLGKNGSGKSTMLKILSGITVPDGGKVKVNRRLNLLLEVSAGFNYEFTGRENIMIRGILLGLTKNEIKEVEKDIIKFAELDEIFIDQQIKRYSSGMIAKLGLAINLLCKPEILVIDEALAVGDVAFQKKVVNKVEEIWKANKCTLLFVSHSEFLVKNFCDRAIVISESKIAFDGSLDKAYQKYNQIVGNNQSS